MENRKIFIPGNLIPPHGFIPVPAYFGNTAWRLGSNGVWAGSQILGLVSIFIITIASNTRLLESGAWLTHLPIRFLLMALPALGFLVVFVNGGLDLSMGSMGALAAAVAATSMNAGTPPAAAIMLALGVSIFFGLVNGVLVGAARLPGLLVTFVTGILVRGLDNVIMGGRIVGIGDALSGMPAVGWIMLLLLTVGAFLWVQYPAYAARSPAGTPRLRELFEGGLPYVVSALFAGIYGLVSAHRLMAASPLTGSALEFENVLIMVLAGVCWYSRYGNVFGVLLACMTMTMLDFRMSILGVDIFIQSVVKGILCLLGLGWLYLYHWIAGLIHRGAVKTEATP